MRFERALRTFGISNAKSWNQIASTLGRTVNDCQVKLRENLLSRCLSTCCNLLASPNPKILCLTKQAFATLVVSTQDKVLPNNPLKKALRPVLKNLADYKNLTIPLLESLGRILELLSRYFKDSLGAQLLRHLQRWAKPQEILETKRWQKGQEPLVAAKIIELFQFLPQSTTFLEHLVKITLTLEINIYQYRDLNSTTSVGCSPYRKALIGYLNRYPKEACRFFLTEGRLSVKPYSDLFQSIVASKYGKPLRAVLTSAAMTPYIISATFCADFLLSEKNKLKAERVRMKSNQIMQAQLYLQDATEKYTRARLDLETKKAYFAANASVHASSLSLAEAQAKNMDEKLTKAAASIGTKHFESEAEVTAANVHLANLNAQQDDLEASHKETLISLENSLKLCSDRLQQAQSLMKSIRAGATSRQINAATSALPPPPDQSPTRVAQVMVASLAEQAKGLARKHAERLCKR